MALNVFKEENSQYLFIFYTFLQVWLFQSFLAVKHGLVFLFVCFTSLNFLGCLSDNMKNAIFRKDIVISEL